MCRELFRAFETMRISTAALFTAACLSANTTSFAQAPPEAFQCNQKTAQMLVEQQVLESKSVVERPKRVNILLRSADFLWPLDTETARAYFVEAFKTAGEHFEAKGIERTQITEKSNTYVTLLPDLRTNVITATAKRDPELAKKFMDQLLAEYEKAAEKRDNSFDKNREPADLLRVAADNAASNPEFSRYVFRRVMRYPLIQDWFYTLYTTAGKDQAFGDSIYLEVLRNYRNELPSRLLNLSAYPFGNAEIFGQTSSRFSGSVPDNFRPNPGLQRTFLETFLDRISSFATNAEESTREPAKNEVPEAVTLVTAINQIEPIVVAKFPDLLQRTSVAKSQANALLTSEMRKNLAAEEKSAASRSLTFDERIKELEEADGKGTLTDAMIAQIIFSGQMKKEENFKKYESWIDKIKDEKLRTDVTSYFWFLRTRLATKEDRLSDAERMSAKVPEVDHRAILLFEIAKKQLDAPNDTNSAFDTLNKVSKLTRSAPNSVAKAQVLFSLVQFYDRLNHSVALDELGEAVRVVNQLQDPELFKNYVFRMISGKDFSFMTSISLPGNNLEGTFSEIGKKDFEMTLANARGFDDKYFRTLAVLAVAKNCVQPKPAAPAKKPQP